MIPARLVPKAMVSEKKKSFTQKLPLHLSLLPCLFSFAFAMG
jgi:hypothetical protein